MIVSLHLAASGVPVFNSSAIQWYHTGVQGLDYETMLVFVGAIDDERPNISGGDYAGQPLQLISQTVGAGGDSFPYGFIFGLYEPTALSGTITVNFDAPVGTSNGYSVCLQGVTGTLTRGLGGLATNPQLNDDFLISQPFTVTHSGALFDLCVTQSSNHTTHLPGTFQTKIADIPMLGSKFSVSYRPVNSGTELVTMRRTDCGGPFAAASMTLAQIEEL